MCGGTEAAIHRVTDFGINAVVDLSLPGITVSIASMLDALGKVGGEAARGRVKLQPDPRIQAIVEGWPARFHTARADAMGFVRDGDFESIVRDYAKEYVR